MSIYCAHRAEGTERTERQHSEIQISTFRLAQQRVMSNQTIEVGERLTTQYQISNKIHILANKLKHHIQPTKKAPLLVKPIVPLNQYMCCKSSGTQDKNNYTIPLSDKEILIGLKEVVKPHIEVNHPCQLGHPDHERWMQQENERLEKYRY